MGEAVDALSGAGKSQRDGSNADALPILESLYATGGWSPNDTESRFHVVSSLT